MNWGDHCNITAYNSETSAVTPINLEPVFLNIFVFIPSLLQTSSHHKGSTL